MYNSKMEDNEQTTEKYDGREWKLVCSIISTLVGQIVSVLLPLLRDKSAYRRYLGNSLAWSDTKPSDGLRLLLSPVMGYVYF